LNEIRVRGTVYSGKGEGAEFVKLPWVRKQIEEKLGFSPFLGTLNIKLTEAEGTKLKNALRKAKATEIVPAAGFHSGKCFRAFMRDNQECVVVIPEINSCPKDVMELVAPANLREKLQLKDGDNVTVRIVLE
jgi:riboflavin kinase